MRDADRPMEMTADVDLCGVDAATQAAAMECMRKEQDLAHEIATVLLKAYPGYPWEIKVEAERAAGMIRLPIMPPNVYFIIPFNRLLNGFPLLEKTVKFAGGELLEQFNLSRSGIVFDQFEEARPRPVLDLKPEPAGAPPKFILNS